MLFRRKEKEFSFNDIYVDKIITDLSNTYANKSSDEYKCKGDITKSPNYDNIEYQLAQLSTIKGYSETDATAMKNMFNALHRPVFKKMATEYLTEPNDKNIVFTAVFTTGYRLLVGELSRILTSSEATDKGFTYKPDKISKYLDASSLIKKYNKDLESKLDKFILQTRRNSVTVQEAATLKALGAVANLAVGTIETVFGVLNGIFKSAASMNPVSLISAILSRSYDKKVEKYEQISKEYELTKKAYDEYKKIPESQRKKRIEHNYTKMIEKYNIKMNNLKAQIDHYDMRAMEEAKDTEKEASKKKETSSSKDTKKSSDNDSKKSESNDDFDF